MHIYHYYLIPISFFFTNPIISAFNHHPRRYFTIYPIYNLSVYWHQCQLVSTPFEPIIPLPHSLSPRIPGPISYPHPLLLLHKHPVFFHIHSPTLLLSTVFWLNKINPKSSINSTTFAKYNYSTFMKFIALVSCGAALIQSVTAGGQAFCQGACTDWDTQIHGTAVRNNVRGEDNLVDGYDNSVDGILNDIAGNSNRIRGEKNGVRGDYNSILGALNRISGDRNAIKGDDNRIKGYNNAILGYSNGIIGDYNKITGEYNDIAGYKNYVNGAQNKVKGNKNLVNGVDNWVYGDINKVSGQSNRVKGDLNVVYGLDNTVVGRGNLVGTRAVIPGIAIEGYNFQDFDVNLRAPCDLTCQSKKSFKFGKH